MTDQLTSYPLLTWEDAEWMRVVRNDSRQFMTTHTDEITEQQQREFLEFTQKDPTNRCWIFCNGFEKVGYGMLRTVTTSDAKSMDLLTLVVDLPHRGKGYGAEIYRCLVERSRAPEVWCVIRIENIASIKALSRAFGPITDKGRYEIVGFFIESTDEQRVDLSFRIRRRKETR
jgi:RimJ/RimL family protein N-acetyltransferase